MPDGISASPQPFARSAVTDLSRFITGAACASVAVAIWAGWLVVMRFGVTTTISVPDLAALRFAVAGLLLLPVVLRRGLAFDRLGVAGIIVLVLGGGVPYLLIVGIGLLFAPVAHAAVLTQGIVPLTVALVAAVVLKERVTTVQKLGLGLIICGGLVIGGIGSNAVGGTASIGHLCFLAAAFLFASYTVTVRRAALDGLHAAGIAAVPSSVIYLPLYVFVFGDQALRLPISDIVIQALYQGVLTAALSIALYGRAIRLIGASPAGAFVALGPVIASLISIPVLGEKPSPLEWAAIVVISTGVVLTSGSLQVLRRRCQPGVELSKAASS
jgi:drug/metabolite transporter (DMT)-like permease